MKRNNILKILVTASIFSGYINAESDVASIASSQRELNAQVDLTSADAPKAVSKISKGWHEASISYDLFGSRKAVIQDNTQIIAGIVDNNGTKSIVSTVDGINHFFIELTNEIKGLFETINNDENTVYVVKQDNLEKFNRFVLLSMSCDYEAKHLHEYFGHEGNEFNKEFFASVLKSDKKLHTMLVDTHKDAIAKSLLALSNEDVAELFEYCNEDMLGSATDFTSLIVVVLSLKQNKNFTDEQVKNIVTNISEFAMHNELKDVINGATNELLTVKSLDEVEKLENNFVRGSKEDLDYYMQGVIAEYFGKEFNVVKVVCENIKKETEKLFAMNFKDMVTLDQEAIENKMKDVLSVNAAFGGLSDNNVAFLSCIKKFTEYKSGQVAQLITIEKTQKAYNEAFADLQQQYDQRLINLLDDINDEVIKAESYADVIDGIARALNLKDFVQGDDAVKSLTTYVESAEKAIHNAGFSTDARVAALKQLQKSSEVLSLALEQGFDNLRKIAIDLQTANANFEMAATKIKEEASKAEEAKKAADKAEEAAVADQQPADQADLAVQFATVSAADQKGVEVVNAAVADQQPAANEAQQPAAEANAADVLWANKVEAQIVADADQEIQFAAPVAPQAPAAPTQPTVAVPAVEELLSDSENANEDQGSTNSAPGTPAVVADAAPGTPAAADESAGQ